MALKEAKHTFKRSVCVQDVSLLLRVVLRVSQVVGAAPMRLRRTRTGWLLGVSRVLVVLQRIVFVVSGSCVSTALILDLLEKNEDKHVFMGGSEVTSFLGSSELVFLNLVHLFGVLSATDTMKSMMAILQQTKEMNCNNYLFKDVKYQRIKVSMLICFIIWKFTSELSVMRRIGAKFNKNKLGNGLYVPCIYQHLLIDMFQLQCSLTVAGINFVLTKINDQLEQLLTKPAIIYYSVKTNVYPNKIRNETKTFDDFPLPGTNIQDTSVTIRQIAQHYWAICEIIWNMNKSHGVFLLLSFKLMFLRILMIQFFIFSNLESSTSITWELSFSCLLLTNMMVIVEPCHWLQDQMKRTRCLLSQIASQCGHSNGGVSRELDLFILQVQTNNAMFAPMGIFVVARPLVATIFGSVFTYLVIVIQMMNTQQTF